MAKFAFGDASGEGFGSSWELHGSGEYSDEVGYQFGTWDEDAVNNSSNYCELWNLTDTLEVMAKDRELDGT